MKKYIFALALSFMLFGCDNKEKAQLERRVDSLNNALVQSKKTEAELNDIGVVLDTIDVNRHMLRARVTEGISYGDYISRLKEINGHIKSLQEKITTLETNQKKSNGVSSATIRRLKNDIELKSREIIALQLDVANLREQNKELIATNYRKDSVISAKDEVIKLRNTYAASLEDQMVDLSNRNQQKVASLYYAQAEALETAANRTKFAARKKKETRREALELYKLSYQLGYVEAQTKIAVLEKKLD